MFKKVLTKMKLVEEEVVIAPKAPAAPTPISYPTSSFTPQPQQVYQSTPAVDPSIVEMLNQSLEESRLSGFDYLKFMSAIDKMATTGAPEDARYKMAFAAAESLGISKADLLKSGEHYVKVLKEDEDGFNSDCNKYEKNEIQSRESKVAELEAQIDNLAKQLTKAQQDHDALKREVQEEKARLELRKTSFHVTLQNFRGVIESNVKKINQYL